MRVLVINAGNPTLAPRRAALATDLQEHTRNPAFGQHCRRYRRISFSGYQGNTRPFTKAELRLATTVMTVRVSSRFPVRVSCRPPTTAQTSSNG